MDSKTVPLFSDFLAIKRSNPSNYWTAKTHEQMTKAYQHHGAAFFNIYEEVHV
tara:strand:- start:213 stop:371 length:159 start_codon:yes stop_codon:yes gene_type:complete